MRRQNVTNAARPPLGSNAANVRAEHVSVRGEPPACSEPAELNEVGRAPNDARHMHGHHVEPGSREHAISTSPFKPYSRRIATLGLWKGSRRLAVGVNHCAATASGKTFQSGARISALNIEEPVRLAFGRERARLRLHNEPHFLTPSQTGVG